MMSLLIELFYSLFPIIAPIALGYLCRKLSLFTSEHAALFRTLVVRVTVPFLIFKNLSKADLAAVSQALPVTAAFLTVSLLYAASGFGLARKLFSHRRLCSSYVFGTFVGNYAFLGWGVLLIFWGEAALTRAVFFSMFFWPGFIVIGFFLVRLTNSGERSGQGGKAPVTRLLLQNASIPIGTVVLSLFCNFYRIVPPKPVWTVIDQFAGITVPLILFAVGLSLKIRMPASDMKVVLLASAHRLILGGLIGWLAAELVGLLFPLDPLSVKVVVLQAVMPTATMSPFFAAYSRMDDRLLGSIIAVSTLISLFTLPLWRIVLDRMYG